MKRQFVFHRSQVDFPIHDLPRDFFETAAVDGHLDPGELTKVRAQRSGQQVHRCRFVPAERYVSHLQALQLSDLTHGVVAELQDASRIVDQRVAGLGKRELRRVAREQRCTDGLFKLLHTLTDRRLGAEHTLPARVKLPSSATARKRSNCSRSLRFPA